MNAFQVDFQIGNINGGQPLEDVILTLYNNESNQINVSATDADGLVSIGVNETVPFYNINYEKLGYHTLNKNITLDPLGDTVIDYMYPISNDGLVRITFGDMLFNDGRIFCVYYNENDRLEGCYKLNDTVQLIVNKGYYIVPRITQSDIFSNPRNIRKNADLYSGMLPSYGLIFLVILLILYVYRRSKRK